ncbi:hypothetical protein RJT34_18175 [Clitoria ternatea]|uniref:Uncharacterized protein n=1 Tax=Clitoria ternatea TaxID=43366 RepID=A0AAN9JDG0_CLITE
MFELMNGTVTPAFWLKVHWFYFMHVQCLILEVFKYLLWFSLVHEIITALYLCIQSRLDNVLSLHRLFVYSDIVDCPEK